MSEFDSYANDYEAALEKGISVSGEDSSFFASGRVEWLSKRLRQLGHTPETVLDFGCGTGGATRFFFEQLGVRAVTGVDSSSKSIEVAQQTYGDLPARFALTKDYTPNAETDLAYCNGVFHHVPLDERPAAAQYIADSLRPGGYFALWENNPWSPAARYVMSRIPFDRDAVMVWPTEARSLLASAGLEVVSADYCFIFPKALQGLRPLESLLKGLPLGAQYQTLARKPM